MISLTHHEAAFKRVSESRFEYFSEPSTKNVSASKYFSISLFSFFFLIEHIWHLNYPFFISSFRNIGKVVGTTNLTMTNVVKQISDIVTTHLKKFSRLGSKTNI